MAPPKYHTRTFRRTPYTLEFELIGEQKTQKASEVSFSDCDFNTEIMVFENLANDQLGSYWTNDVEGLRFLALHILGVPCVADEKIHHSIHMRELNKAWRNEDQVFHFAGDISADEFSQALSDIRSSIPFGEWNQIEGYSKAAKAKRAALFSSSEAYRAFCWDRRYFIAQQLCEKYGLKVVYIPSNYVEFAYSG